MDYTALRNEIQTDPAGLGYAAYLSHAPGIVVDILNARTTGMNKERYINSRTVLAERGFAGTIALDKIKAFASLPPFQDGREQLRSPASWAMGYMQSAEGLDIGHPQTQVMLDYLAGAGIITAEEADLLKSMAYQSASRAEVVLGAGTFVTEADLRAAMETV